jgi:mono/diheme cytochrome c family protein
VAKQIVSIRIANLLTLVCACVFTIHLAIALDNAALPSANNRFDYAELAKAPAKVRGRKNPQEGNAEAVLVGRKLFAQHCAECHGSAAEGGKKAPSLQVDEVQQATPGSLFWVLTNGVVRRGMPVWSKLPEPQRWAIVTYIKSMKVSQPPDATAK